MNDFKRIMYSTSMVVADSNMDSIVCNTDDEAMNSPFSRHVAKLYERKEERVMTCRSDIINRGHNNSNYAEATFRIVKYIILTRLKAYNSLVLLDYVVVALVKYYCGRLLNLVGSKSRIFFIRRLQKRALKLFSRTKMPCC